MYSCLAVTCHCGNTGVERTPNMFHYAKLTLEEKILPPLLPGFELATFRSRVRRSYLQAIPALRIRICSLHFTQLQVITHFGCNLTKCETDFSAERVHETSLIFGYCLLLLFFFSFFFFFFIKRSVNMMTAAVCKRKALVSIR